MRHVIGRVRGGLGAGARLASSPAALCGAAIEVAWLTAHVALYPTGLTKERRPEFEHFSVQGLPPLKRAFMTHHVEAAGTPVLLVHGLVDNRSVFTVLRRGLRRRGFGRVATMNYSPLTSDVRAAATMLAQRVEEMCEETGY